MTRISAIAGKQPPMKHVQFPQAPAGTESLKAAVHHTITRHLWGTSLITAFAGACATFLVTKALIQTGTGTALLIALFSLTATLIAAGVLISISVRRFTSVATLPVESLLAYLSSTHEDHQTDGFQWNSGKALQISQFEGDLRLLDKRMKSMARKVRLTIADLEKAREQANEQNLAKSKFLANMSHELRTPLNAILGYAMLLQEDASDEGNDAMVSDLVRIQQAGHTLLARINDILEISKIKAGKLVLEREVIDLPILINEITSRACAEDQRNGNEFILNMSPDIGIMIGDMENLQQCLQNLLGNAFKFTENGRISLTVERSQDASLPVITFTVQDNGIGMDPEDIEGLFTAFEQGDSSLTRKYGGTGLGLAITRNLARLMGGDCLVESARDVGSTFRLVLPAGSSQEATSIIPATDYLPLLSKNGPDITHLHVLVIDDDEDALELMRRWLQQMGLTVMTTISPDEGLAMARQYHPDVILLDGLLPDRSGYDILTDLRADPAVKDIPTVLITVDDDRRRGIIAGASDYIRKPLSKEQLRSVVELYCGKVDGEILVIEDDDDAAELIRRSVEEAGFTTRRAANGVQGLEMADEIRPSAIVLDLAMPGLDGFGVIDHLKKHQTLHNVPLIVLSGQEITLEQHRKLAANGQRFFAKAASTPRQIAQCLKELVQ